MKEYEKLLLEDTKRQECLKAKNEVELGLFEQKEEATFDFSKYTLMTYGKKYKGLYDLYQNIETKELVYVCPLIEDNKGSEDERKDLLPYAYDVIYLDYLTPENYELVKKAHVHEKSMLINVFYFAGLGIYFAYLVFVLLTIAVLATNNLEYSQFIWLAGPIIAIFVVATILLPVLLIQYRKYKAQ